MVEIFDVFFLLRNETYRVKFLVKIICQNGNAIENENYWPQEILTIQFKNEKEDLGEAAFAAFISRIIPTRL